MKKILLIAFIVLCAGFTAFAIESTKPDSHNESWTVLHGKQARVSDAECLTCHTDKLECIQCHEDTKPRSHNASWTVKGHGMESRWNRNTCKTCHTEDFCVECHETAIPISHNAKGFLGASTTHDGSAHCAKSCQVGTVRWSDTRAKDCLVCHKSRPSAVHSGPAIP